ncbi:WD40-repeat-containing domain protein [Cladorrhinum samala]|uniref:WD40-repeat-containing domain protein n=1 Tax=Cladorrhinum samala TaxID=585594 RepID=A0AAV9HEK8_9PEZI|nr:WD40-repeat-containing domain protein [Cladorrhinum samala]
MVKSYLKFEPSKSFGVVTSSTSNLVWSRKEKSGGTGAGQAIVASNEEVLIWDVKKGELLGRWWDESCKAQVTAIAQSKTDPDVFAVGYENGSIRLWDSKIATSIVSFNGHKSAITALAFDKTGVRLASGARDTDVIIWDLVAEVGQYKLRGHKDQITGLRFIEPEPIVHDDEGGQALMAVDSETAEGFLLTTGKDALIKLWDLSSRHCIETHVAQSNGECWALGLSPDLDLCVTAGNDGEMKVWALDVASLAASAQHVDLTQSVNFLHDRGTLHRSSKERAVEVVFHPRRDYFAVHGVEKNVEIWRIRSESEIKKSLARKKKRRKEKAAKDKKGAEAEVEDAEGDDITKAEISDVFVQHLIARTTGKVRSVDWATGGSTKDLQLLVGMTNNLLELYTVVGKDKLKSKGDAPDYNKALAVELPGHRTDVRSLSISSDDKMLASAANGSLKIWNIRTQACIRTFECGYALCCAFLPGDKVVVVGTKEGELQLYDVGSAALLESVNAHDGHAVWALQVHPDGKSVVSGGADKTAKFWDFKIIQEQVLGTTRTTPKLKLVQSRILKVSDDILSLKFSPDSKLLAVALLDSTVKVFFVDTLKLYLNLYGHKLPVLSMDISYDSKLIVTSSADKNIRIWGLDFGDCHKALFGHQDSILQVAFIPHNSDGNGHHFFSASKDRTIKYWDGDKFEQIQRIDGHFGEIWALAVSHSGRVLVSASHDKSIRVWEESDEQIFLEEEREKELEELYESTLTTSLEQDEDAQDENREVAAASKQTVETLMAGERIAEALELGMADLNVVKEWEEAKLSNPNMAPPQRNPIFMALGNISAEQYVMSTLQKIKASALHDALLVLPFASVPMLFTFLNIFALRSMNIPLTCRILFFMLKTHHKQIVSSKTMKGMLDGIRTNLRGALRKQKDEMGYNIAALKVVGMQIADKGVREYVDDKWEEEEESSKKKEVRKRAFASLS